MTCPDVDHDQLEHVDVPVHNTVHVPVYSAALRTYTTITSPVHVQLLGPAAATRIRSSGRGRARTDIDGDHKDEVQAGLDSELGSHSAYCTAFELPWLAAQNA